MGGGESRLEVGTFAPAFQSVRESSYTTRLSQTVGVCRDWLQVFRSAEAWKALCIRTLPWGANESLENRCVLLWTRVGRLRVCATYRPHCQTRADHGACVERLLAGRRRDHSDAAS